jgi:hypothetical protein
MQKKLNVAVGSTIRYDHKAKPRTNSSLWQETVPLASANADINGDGYINLIDLGVERAPANA